MPTGATTFNYDLNGNRTSATSPTGSTSLSWQSTSGRLICVNTAGTSCSTTSPSSTTSLYSYDGKGHRATSSTNGVTNAFIWDTGASQLLADSTHDYVYLGGSVTPDLQINLTSGTVDLLIQDQNANTRGVVQVTGATSALNGTIVNYTDYDAYGNAITQSGGTVNPGAMSNGGVSTDISTSFAFGAGYLDASNLTYLVHRYLDNETGQFISVDPLVDQTRQAYIYAGDGPVMAIDPHGMYACDARPWTWLGCAGKLIGSTKDAVEISVKVAYALSGIALKQYAEYMREQMEEVKTLVKSGVNFVGHHFGDISSVFAIVGCMTGVGLGFCIAYTSFAFAARVVQRSAVDHVAIFSSLNATDLLLTTASLGLVGVPLAKSEALLKDLPASFRYFVKSKAAAGDVLNLICGAKKKECP